MGDIERWECQACGEVLDASGMYSHPKRREPNRRCHGPVGKVEYVRADLYRRAVEDRNRAVEMLNELTAGDLPPEVQDRFDAATAGGQYETSPAPRESQAKSEED